MVSLNEDNLQDLLPYLTELATKHIADDDVESLNDLLVKVRDLEQDLDDWIEGAPAYKKRYDMLRAQKEAIEEDLRKKKEAAEELEKELSRYAPNPKHNSGNLFGEPFDIGALLSGEQAEPCDHRAPTPGDESTRSAFVFVDEADEDIDPETKRFLEDSKELYVDNVEHYSAQYDPKAFDLSEGSIDDLSAFSFAGDDEDNDGDDGVFVGGEGVGVFEEEASAGSGVEDFIFEEPEEDGDPFSLLEDPLDDDLFLGAYDEDKLVAAGIETMLNKGADVFAPSKKSRAFGREGEEKPEGMRKKDLLASDEAVTPLGSDDLNDLGFWDDEHQGQDNEDEGEIMFFSNEKAERAAGASSQDDDVLERGEMTLDGFDELLDGEEFDGFSFDDDRSEEGINNDDTDDEETLGFDSPRDSQEEKAPSTEGERTAPATSSKPRRRRRSKGGKERSAEEGRTDNPPTTGGILSPEDDLERMLAGGGGLLDGLA